MDTAACKILPTVVNPLLLREGRVTDYLRKLAADNGFKGIQVSRYGVNGPNGIAREFVRVLNEKMLNFDLPLCVV